MDSGGITFDVAAPADDAEVRRLFRDNPMGGAIRLSLEREPDASHAAGIEGDAHQTVVGRRGDGRLCAVGTRSVRTAFVNGHPTRLGYLGGLRVDADHRNDPRLLLRGYAKLRELHEADGSVRMYLTSVVADNAPARRFLEAGLRGMPTYRLVGEFVTLVMRVRRGQQRPGGDVTRCAIAALLEDAARQSQFAPQWSCEQLASASLARGLAISDVRVSVDGHGRPVGCAALWDQRPFKQAVVRGYAPGLSRWRAALNAAAVVTGRPRLPAIGEPMRAAFVSHIVGTPEVIVTLVGEIHTMAATRSLDYLMAGFPAGDERLAALRRTFGGRELRSRLYVVHWSDGRAAADALDGRPLGPEVAVL